MTGYLRYEIIGKRPGDLLAGLDSNLDTMQKMRNKMEAKEAVEDYLLHIPKKACLTGRAWL